MNPLSPRWSLLVWPFAVGIAVAAQDPKRTAVPATAEVQSRTYTQDGQKVTERVVTTTSREVEATKPRVLKAAIFVSNNAHCDAAERLNAIEDMIISGVTQQGLQVIARETALNAVQKLDNGGATANKLDDELAKNSSAIRLAQNLGADLVLHVSVTSYDTKTNKVDAYGVKATTEQQTLRLTYKLIDGVTGGSMAAETVTARRNAQTTSTASEDNQGVLNDLLEEAAQKVATSVKRSLDDGRLASVSAAPRLVTLSILTEAADVMIPDVRIGAENTVTISESKFKVTPLSVTVEIDGIAVGSAPGKVQVRPGLSKLRLTRDGFRPYERTINATDGLSLVAALQMSDAGYARWQDATTFLNALKNGAKLTDAQVKVLEGKARMLEQSGYRINVNTKEGITIKNQSLFSN